VIGNDCIGRYKSNYHTITNYGYNKKYFRFICGGNGSIYKFYNITGADPGFHIRGGALKKFARAEGGAKMFGVFRVKNHDFTPKIIFYCTDKSKYGRITNAL
jgi:hypothetical protein